MTQLGQHPRHGLDELLTNGVRLSIIAALSGVERAEFGAIRDLVEISNPALSKQAAALEAAGYVEVSKGRIGRRPRTWLQLTGAGRDALNRHLSALQHITTATPRA
ncbi:winged helix-turn-helix domain-containing protein [Micromonospora sp. DT201]|uniref:winged helix-turn-helix domain-containing protein n=1 Tax=Micromonospora sp. DT201 TaxID=3393442 RepID=UPI003CFBAF08